MPRFFGVTFSNTGRNTAQGLNIHHATMTDDDILRAASAEARRQGTTLEALAGIRTRNDKASGSAPERAITSEEALAVALEKLAEDGRVFDVAEIRAEPDLESIGQSTRAEGPRSEEEVARTYNIRYQGKTVQAQGVSALGALKAHVARYPFREYAVFPGIRIKAVDAATGGKVSGEFSAPGPNGQEIGIGVERVE